METAFNLYQNSCPCGVKLQNNCAHYLSNSMIRAGFKLENYPGFAVCQKGRPIRASQMKVWFQQHSSVDKQFPVIGRIYACYQQRQGFWYSLSKNVGLQKEKGHVFFKRYIKQGAKTVEDTRGTMGSVNGYTEQKCYHIN